MARTKASVGAKISSGKSSKARCSAAPTTSTGVSSGSSDKNARSAGGGNPVCPRETPKWQKPITNFFINKHNESRESDGDGETAGSSISKPKPKRNVIESSDEETSPEKPKNNALDETIELETLTGKNSHKIQEYYPNGVKGKGVGKKTKEKNNVAGNGESEKEDIGDEKSKENSNENLNNEKDETNKTEDKENIDSNISESETELQNGRFDKDSNIKERSKRERDDSIEEEENVSKKIKVN